MNYSL